MKTSTKEEYDLYHCEIFLDYFLIINLATMNTAPNNSFVVYLVPSRLFHSIKELLSKSVSESSVSQLANLSSGTQQDSYKTVQRKF